MGKQLGWSILPKTRVAIQDAVVKKAKHAQGQHGEAVQMLGGVKMPKKITARTILWGDGWNDGLEDP